MAHTIAPGASIVLAVTGVETFPSVASLTALSSVYKLAEQRGVSVVDATGDNGATSNELDPSKLYARPVVDWPASDPLVIAVGGTDVPLNASGHPVREPQAWSGSSGGVSSVFGRPGWQAGVEAIAGSHRGLPDISMAASCPPAAEIYATPRIPAVSGLDAVCGTSVSAPMFAGLVALADQLAGHRLGLLNPTIYRLGEAHAPGIVDVTTGDNATRVLTDNGSVLVKGYSAKKGYDLVSGWGTVDGRNFVPELAGRSVTRREEGRQGRAEDRRVDAQCPHRSKSAHRGIAIGERLRAVHQVTEGRLVLVQAEHDRVPLDEDGPGARPVKPGEVHIGRESCCGL